MCVCRLRIGDLALGWGVRRGRGLEGACTIYAGASTVYGGGSPVDGGNNCVLMTIHNGGKLRFRAKRGVWAKARPPQRIMQRESEFFMGNLLVRIHLIIEMIAVDRPCAMDIQFPFPGSFIATFLEGYANQVHARPRRPS